MKDLLIFGTGGNCLDILDTVLEINETSPQAIYRILGFLDDNESLWGKEIGGYPVLGPLQKARSLPHVRFINGIGSIRNYWRKRQIIDAAAVCIDQFETIVHPRASVSRFARLGAGTVVLQHVTINVAVRIGKQVMILPNSVVSHDAVIGDYSCLASSVCLAGGVKVGEACYLGAQSSVNNDVQVGDFSLVGMGSVVLKDVPPKSVVVGVPARVIRAAC